MKSIQGKQTMNVGINKNKWGLMRYTPVQMCEGKLQCLEKLWDTLFFFFLFTVQHSRFLISDESSLRLCCLGVIGVLID